MAFRLAFYTTALVNRSINLPLACNASAVHTRASSASTLSVRASSRWLLMHSSSIHPAQPLAIHPSIHPSFYTPQAHSPRQHHHHEHQHTTVFIRHRDDILTRHRRHQFDIRRRQSDIASLLASSLSTHKRCRYINVYVLMLTLRLHRSLSG